jgi:hypothetical protein
VRLLTKKKKKNNSLKDRDIYVWTQCFFSNEFGNSSLRKGAIYPQIFHHKSTKTSCLRFTLAGREREREFHHNNTKTSYLRFTLAGRGKTIDCNFFNDLTYLLLNFSGFRNNLCQEKCDIIACPIFLSWLVIHGRKMGTFSVSEFASNVCKMGTCYSRSKSGFNFSFVVNLEVLIDYKSLNLSGLIVRTCSCTR